jgi:hypothetical protein
MIFLNVVFFSKSLISNKNIFSFFNSVFIEKYKNKLFDVDFEKLVKTESDFHE